MKKILVAGFGNILMGDDGVGVEVCKILQASYPLPPDTEVMDAGTCALSVPFEEYHVVIAVDAVKLKELSPGSVVVMGKKELLNSPQPLHLSGHGMDFAYMLQTLEFAGKAPRDFWLVGIVPLKVSTGIGLSPVVQRAIPTACQKIKEIISLYSRGTSLPSS